MYSITMKIIFITPCGTRTHNLLIRSQTRYPISPRGHKNMKKILIMYYNKYNKCKYNINR